jgi:hypothetical protein
MSYIEYDPTNPADFNNFVSKQQKEKKLIKAVILIGITVLVLYLISREPVIEKDDDIEVS